MLSSLNQIETPNVQINSVIIRPNGPGLIVDPDSAEQDTVKFNIEIDLVKKTSLTDALSLYSMSFIEDINEPHMSGSLIVVDSSNIFDHLGISTAGEIVIDLSFFDVDHKSSERKLITTNKKLYFYILDISVMNDPASQDVSRSSGTANYITIRFASKEFVSSDFNIYSLLADTNVKTPQHFIGPISKELDGKILTEEEQEKLDEEIAKEENQKPKLDYKQTLIGEGTEDQEAVLDENDLELYTLSGEWTVSHPSFFEMLIGHYNKERKTTNATSEETDQRNNTKKILYSHASYNDVWIKPDYFFYPSYKPSTIPRITQIINYIKQHTCLKEDPNFVDFMFWEDLRGFHFKSIAKMVFMANPSNQTMYYYPDVNSNSVNAILSMNIIKDTEPVELIASGGLYSEYIKIKPNWRSPFRNSTSGSDTYDRKLIRYSYYNDIFSKASSSIGKQADDVIITNKRWGEETKGYSPFSSKDLKITDSSGDFIGTPFRISDEIFGYYDTTLNNSKTAPWWQYLNKNLNSYDLAGITFDLNNDGSGLTYNFLKQNRMEEEYWQSQFDICDLPGAGAYLIYNYIKWPINILENRQKYADAKKLEQKWKFYFDNICCERKVPQNFFALLTKATKIYGGDGLSFAKDSGGMYAYDWTEVEFWPRDQVDAVLQTGDEIIKFENHETFPFVFVKPKGGLEGHGEIKKQYKQKSGSHPHKEKENYKKLWDEKITPINKDDYYTTKNTRAFNINEILNSVGITALPGDDPITAVETEKQVLKQCQFLFTAPGLAFPFDKTADCASSYPKQFKMMPVGSYRIVGNCDTPGLNDKEIMFGRIVQMHAIPKEIMATISKGEQGLTGICMGSPEESITINEQQYTKIKNTSSPYLFLFDVVNAHDGLCDQTCSI